MCWCVDVLVIVLMCWCVDVLVIVLMCWLLCWCVDDCVDLLMCWGLCWVLMCWCVDVLVIVLMCWLWCWCVDDCVDVDVWVPVSDITGTFCIFYVFYLLIFVFLSFFSTFWNWTIPQPCHIGNFSRFCVGFVQVLLVGGITNIPKIEEKICSYFNRSNITSKSARIPPEEVIAQGSAIQAAILSGELGDLPNLPENNDSTSLMNEKICSLNIFATVLSISVELSDESFVCFYVLRNFICFRWFWNRTEPCKPANHQHINTIINTSTITNTSTQ